ncbi:MAG: sodium:calcium antiporter [Chloroflexia bacterium]|nr:sodium:calcium antiporter [Chloroflexia bacterium]
MIWLQFAISALILVFAAVKLAEYGDAIGYHTKLSGMFIGALLIASATSLPEILTMINSISQDHVNLTAGDLFGSSMFNMLLLGALDMIFYKNRILRRVALKHALTASLGLMLTGMAVLFLLADVNLKISWLGGDSLLMMATYFVGIWLLRKNPVAGTTGDPVVLPESTHKIPPLRRAIVGFVVTAAVLVAVAPWMVRSGSGIAKVTGLGDGFVGIVLIALVTSIPELVAMIAAVRFGAYDMAVGNLFGSNIFNMFALALADVFYLQGSFLGAIDPAFALAGLLAMLLTCLGLIGNLALVERRVWIVELDALLLIVSYLAGVYLLYLRGVGG